MTAPPIAGTSADAQAGLLNADASQPDQQETGESQRVQRAVAQIILRLRIATINRRWAVDRNTFLNEAFDKDAQYTEFDPARRVVVNIPAPRDSVRRTINLMKPYNRTQESRLVRGQPSYQVQADQGDPNAEDAAELGNDLIKWIEKLIDIRKVRQKIAFWLQRAGTCLLFPLWDFDGGDQVEGEDGGEPMAAGQPFTDVHPPHECFYYPITGTDIESCTGIGRDVRLGREEAIQQFPSLRGKLLTPDSDDSRSSSRLTRAIRDFPPGQQGWHSQTLAFGVTGVYSSDNDEAQEHNETMLIEFWLEPGGALLDIGGSELFSFPQGLRVIMTSIGEIGHWGPNVYGTLPAVRIGFSESAGFWSPSPCTPLRPLQMAINWAYSLWEEHMMLAGRPVMLWPRQAKAAWRRLQDLTTKVLQFAAGPRGQQPSYLAPPTFPAQLPGLLEFLIQMWQDISGVHEVSRGQLPAAGISGVAIQLLQDQDDTQIGFAVGEIERGLAKMMELHLENIRQFVEFEQLASMAGDSATQAQYFKGTDLGQGLKVSVRPGSALPKAPAATEAKAKEAWLGGYMMDEFNQPDWRRLLVIMGLGEEDRLFDELQQDKNNAEMEYQGIMGLGPDEVQLILAFVQVSGTLPDELMPRRYDDHIVHEMRHKRQLKELREQMGTGDGRVTETSITLLELHWEMHQLPALEQRMGMPQLGGFGAATGEVNPQGQPGAEPQAGAAAAQQQKASPTPA
ncbi:MAG: hypothetical protein GY906_30125 [bacterium]|nr:hypothetical protein [bacterium]